MTSPDIVADVADVAARLTKAQRELLLMERPRCVKTYKPFAKLRDLGCLVGSTGRYGSHVVSLTDLGFAVRAHLQGSKS